MHPNLSLDPSIKPTLSVENAAEIFGIALSTAYAGVKDGTIPSIRLGGRIRIPTAAVRRLLQLDEITNVSPLMAVASDGAA